jgi:hypothetical protein
MTAPGIDKGAAVVVLMLSLVGTNLEGVDLSFPSQSVSAIIRSGLTSVEEPSCRPYESFAKQAGVLHLIVSRRGQYPDCLLSFAL